MKSAKLIWFILAFTLLHLPLSSAQELRLDMNNFYPGGNIQVYFEAPGSFDRSAWVGIIPSSVAHGSEAENDKYDLTYQYLEKRTSGTLTFNAPQEPGSYDLRMFDTDDNGREAASVSFVVSNIISGGSMDLWGKYPDLSGTWYMGGPINVGMPCRISQLGGTLTFTNENGNTVEGDFINSNTVEATGWNGLRGVLSEDNERISWANGSWWTRERSIGSMDLWGKYPDLSGTWYMGGPINVGMPCRISQLGGTLTFTNENGNTVEGDFINSNTVEATGWNGLTGVLSEDNKRISWANGSWWTR